MFWRGVETQPPAMLWDGPNEKTFMILGLNLNPIKKAVDIMLSPSRNCKDGQGGEVNNRMGF